MLRQLILAALVGAPAALAVAAPQTIMISGMQFAPAQATVAVGDKITWKNDDIVPHTVTSASFKSGQIDPGKSWSTTVKKAGTISYKCSFHPTMAATLVVQ